MMNRILTLLALALLPTSVFSQSDECPYHIFQDERENILISLPLSDTLEFEVGMSGFSLQLMQHSGQSLVVTEIFGHRYEYEATGLKIIFPINAFKQKLARKKVDKTSYEYAEPSYALVFRLDQEIVFSDHHECFTEMIRPWVEQ